MKSEEVLAWINAMPGWVKEMGIVVTAATEDEVACEWEVTEKHHQGYGIVHGGVHCGVIETLASIGAADACSAAPLLIHRMNRARSRRDAATRRRRSPRSSA